MEGIQVSTQVAGSRNQISIIKVGGYIDTTTSSEVERALNSMLKQGRYQIIIDLGNVDYISSAGWGIFISEIKSIREHNGDLKLVRMIPDVYEIFELLEFHHILEVYDTVEEAIRKFEESQYVEMIPDSGSAQQSGQPFMGETSSTSTPTAPQTDHTPPISREPVTEQTSQDDSAPPREPNVLDLVNMSVEDKIRYIVAQNPDLGAYKINKELNTAKFGFTQLGWFGVRSMLNKLGLNSRKRRREFAIKYRYKK
ncbi:MAG: anti-sigma factor antagonist [Calditrichaeota bacterium]|nr:MAG: anti-sigma factor antagonist [Calditrichota bacterium]